MTAPLPAYTHLDQTTWSRADRHYRTSLTRRWDGLEPGEPGAFHVLWIMLNPSTADDQADDATIRRVRRFSHDWGFGGFRVANLFDLRATDPATLADLDDDVPTWTYGGDQELIRMMQDPFTDTVVAAWGAHPIATRRAAMVIPRLANVRAYHLGLTKSGQPRHPLYVRADTPLRPLAGSLAESMVA